MNPEEKFKQEMADMIGKIKSELLYSIDDKTVEYRIDYDLNEITDPEKKLEMKLLRKIEKMDAISILGIDPMPEDFQVEFHIVNLKVIEPKFSEVYKTYSTTNTELIDEEVDKESIIKYQIEIKETREIVLNDKYILARPQLAGENHYFIEYVLSHPNTLITKKIIENDKKITINKSFYQILNDLNFNSELKKIFFPQLSSKAIMFINKHKDTTLLDIKINKKALNSYIKTLEKFKQKL